MPALMLLFHGSIFCCLLSRLLVLPSNTTLWMPSQSCWGRPLTSSGTACASWSSNWWVAVTRGCCTSVYFLLLLNLRIYDEANVLLNWLSNNSGNTTTRYRTSTPHALINLPFVLPCDYTFSSLNILLISWFFYLPYIKHLEFTLWLKGVV